VEMSGDRKTKEVQKKKKKRKHLQYDLEGPRGRGKEKCTLQRTKVDARKLPGNRRGEGGNCEENT